jgi:hypothetical protein
MEKWEWKMRHTLKLREVGRSRTGSMYGTGPVIQYEIDGMPTGEKAFIANMEASQQPARWQVLRVKGGLSRGWKGDYKTAADALEALHKELDH